MELAAPRVTHCWSVVWWWPVARRLGSWRIAAPWRALPNAAEKTQRFFTGAHSSGSDSLFSYLAFIFAFGFGKLKHIEVCSVLLLISVKTLIPSGIVVACAYLLQRMIIHSHSCVMNAYLPAFFHTDCCGTRIVFSLTRFDTHSPAWAYVFSN